MAHITREVPNSIARLSVVVKLAEASDSAGFLRERS